MEPAIGEYQRVLSLQPQHTYALIDLAVALTMTDRPGQALSLLGRVRGRDAQRPELQFALGLCQLSLKNWPAAEAALSHSLALGLRRAEVYERLAAALLQMRRHADAVVCLQTALQLQPNFVGALASLGDVQLQLGNGADAVICYRRWSALQPMDAAAHAALGSALLTVKGPGGRGAGTRSGADARSSPG